MKKFRKYILVVAVLLLVYKCANQQPPTGGDVDRIPPEVFETYPLNGQTNFIEDYIQISFSEYVDKRSVKEAIFISPTIEGELDYDWSGTDLTIYFEKDSLKANTTYIVTVGTDVKDLNNGNNLENTITIAFSTGSKIDNGMITGKVFADDLLGTSIYAYKLIDSVEFNPLKTKPDYISQVSKNGSFQLLGLVNAKYRLLAIKDNFKDRLYNREDDYFGTTTKDIEITETDSVFANLKFKLTIEDTTKPSVQNITMTDQHHLFLELSEPVDTSKLFIENFTIVDSSTGISQTPNFIYKGKSKTGQLLIAFPDTLNEDGNYFLHTSNLIDYAENKSNKEITSFVYNELKDTNSVKILDVKKQFKDDQIDFVNPRLTLLLDDGVGLENIKRSVSFYDSRKNKLEVIVSKINDAEFNIDIKSKLEPKKEYSLEVNSNYLIDIAGNKLDSVFTYKMNTINDLDFSGVSGRVNYSGGNNTYVVLITAQKKAVKNVYQQKSEEGSFKIERVIPGKYLVWAFEDSDSNSVYSFGNAEPFEFAERFVYYPDTLNLRPRWPVGDMLLDLND